MLTVHTVLDPERISVLRRFHPRTNFISGDRISEEPHHTQLF